MTKKTTPTLTPPTPQETATEPMTAPHGSATFSMSDHVPCMGNEQHLRYFQVGASALPEACRDGHAKAAAPKF